MVSSLLANEWFLYYSVYTFYWIASLITILLKIIDDKYQTILKSAHCFLFFIYRALLNIFLFSSIWAALYLRLIILLFSFYRFLWTCFGAFYSIFKSILDVFLDIILVIPLFSPSTSFLLQLFAWVFCNDPELGFYLVLKFLLSKLF